MDEFDRGAGVADAEAVEVQDVAIDFGVQVGEAGGKVEFLAVDGDGTVGQPPFWTCSGRSSDPPRGTSARAHFRVPGSRTCVWE